MNDHDPHGPTATVLALTARHDEPDEPAFALQVGADSVGEQVASSLAAAGVRVAEVLTRPGWESLAQRTFGEGVSVVPVADRDGVVASASSAATAPTLLVPGHVLAPAFVLRSLVQFPSEVPAVLLLDVAADGFGVGVSVVQAHVDRLADVDLDAHVDAMSGVVWLPGGTAVRSVGDSTTAVDHAGRLGRRPDDDLVLAAGVVESVLADGGDVRAVSPRHAIVDVIADPASADRLSERRAAGPSDDDVRMRNSVKEWDGWFTTFFVSPVTQHAARFLGRRNVAPNLVTFASLVVAFAAAALLFVDGAAPAIVAAILLQLSFALDCVDGQLARYSSRFSRVGAYFDVVSDRVKEFAVMVAMAWVVGTTSIWIAAAAAFALQTMRHSRNFTFGRDRQGSGPHAGDGRPTSAPARRGRDEHGSGAGYWLRRVATFSIGERLAVLSLGMAFGANEIALWVYVGWVLVAVSVQYVGRMRSADLRPQLDMRDLDLVPFGGAGAPWPGADVALVVATLIAAIAVDAAPVDAVVPVIWLIVAVVLARHIRPRSAAAVSLVDFVPAIVLIAVGRPPEALGCLAAVLAVMWADRTYERLFSLSPPRAVTALRLGVIPRQAVVLVAATIERTTEASIVLIALISVSLGWGWILGAHRLSGPRERQDPAVSLP